MEKKNIFHSSIEDASGEVVIGVDEAGRGPVVGYMVYAALVIPAEKSEDLPFKDSKELTAEQRESHFSYINDLGLGYAYFCAHPSFISDEMISGRQNLNEIALHSIHRVLDDAVGKSRNVRSVYVDALGNCAKLEDALRERLGCEVVVSEKADSRYKAVSGASIVAKVMRDRLLREFEGDFGSGYPSDPSTVRWLKRNINRVFGFPECVRHSWSTVQSFFDSRRSKPLKGRLQGFFLDHN
jgi:ribonuclease H2 subunit A